MADEAAVSAFALTARMKPTPQVKVKATRAALEQLRATIDHALEHGGGVLPMVEEDGEFIFILDENPHR
jgi:hypothetical protein